jgi:hypothetical protein
VPLLRDRGRLPLVRHRQPHEASATALSMSCHCPCDHFICPRDPLDSEDLGSLAREDPVAQLLCSAWLQLGRFGSGRTARGSEKGTCLRNFPGMDLVLYGSLASNTKSLLV